MYPIALSTMWLRDRFDSLGEFFDAGRELGFDQFELNHFITLDLVRRASLPVGQIQSVHIPCPTQPHSADAQVGALDREERATAVEAAKQSIDLAQQVGAKAVVLHPGEVDLDPNLEKQMRRLYNQGRRETLEYADLKNELIEQRARHVGPHLDATRWSLERLAGYADSAGIRLGLENRFNYHQIPLPDEMHHLVQEFEGPVGFWFDLGHARVLEELGLVDHREWLGFNGRLIGMHIHDVHVVSQDGGEPTAKGTDTRLSDHMMPGTGVVDVSEVLPPADDRVLLTCEFSWEAAPEQVIAGREHLLRYLS